ncbi:hypothetical protein Lepto7375DRAFT_1347 [Leptolyngbya sp. PCC 7375]|nr:hypothetical protein Lepto7375DRAFT_1347 [Leptolyngbya sp. PCC 7375]
MLVKPSLPLRLPGGLRALVLLSVFLHGGLLLLPMPQWWSIPVASDPEEVIEESGAIAITTLPIIPQSDPPLQPEAPTIPEPEPVAPPPLIQVPDKVLEIEELLIEDTLEELEDLEEAEQPIEPSDEDELDPENSEPEAGIAFQFGNDFPHLAGSQAGCYGLENCRTAEGQNYIDAVQDITNRLEAQGYELKLYEGNDDSDVRNHRIFEMRLPDQAEIKYLNVFGEGLRTAIYIITPRIITQEELQTLGHSDSPQRGSPQRGD